MINIDIFLSLPLLFTPFLPPSLLSLPPPPARIIYLSLSRYPLVSLLFLSPLSSLSSLSKISLCGIEFRISESL